MTSKQERGKKERRFSQEQYDMLKCCSKKKDMTEWNEWRKTNPEEEVLLEGANLLFAHLQGANLTRAVLKHANLGVAHLENTNLKSADLSNAHLNEAKLAGANLEDTKLKGANLSGVNLSGFDLKGIDLSNAYLDNARLSGAQLQNAIFYNAHLRNAELSGANLGGTNLKGADLERARLKKTCLRGAELTRTNLKGADLEGADLQDAVLWEAKLQKANLRESCLREANLKRTHLQGAEFGGAKLQGADFSRAIVDGETLIWRCEVNHNTKFEAVGLGSTRIYPDLKQRLEYNIRRMNWEGWYKEHWFWRWPVQLFWAMSDYGISTLQIMKTFFQLALIFAAIYLAWGLIDYYLVGLKDAPGIVSNLFVLEGEQETVSPWLVPFRSVYFSIVTMTTLGFGDMYANAHSFLRGLFGHALLGLQVILGYVLLGALITRFAVLFTAGGPAGKFAEEKKKTGDSSLRVD